MDPSTATDIGVGVVASGNIGHITLDASDNICIGDFSARIVRVDSGGTTAKDVVNIAGPTTCDSSQTGVSGNEPAFRGFAISPDGDLFASGYCLDTVYMFSQADLQNAWDTDTPITTLPAPVLENPSGALDGPNFNGTFGLAFWSGSGGVTPTAMCRGVAATIVGTSGDDVIVGLQGNDII